jgi:hypothetical protein
VDENQSFAPVFARFSAILAGTGPPENALTKAQGGGEFEGVFRTLELADIAVH